MAYLIANGTTPQVIEIRNLKQQLWTALNTSLGIQRQMVQMTDAQVEAQFGVPVGAVPTFRTTVDNAVTALQAASVTAIVSQLGFDR